MPSPSSKYQQLQQAALEANLALNQAGLVVATFGNASVFDPDKRVFAIKPSGVDYLSLTADQIVIVDLEMNVIHGDLRPSSDTNTHAVLYQNFTGVHSIAHTHSTHAVAWAQALREIPVYGTTHADHLTCAVPCTDLMADERIEGDYEIETGNQIVEHFRRASLSPSEVEMVLVGGHGPFTWGTSPQKAVYHSVVLEEIARMAMLTEGIDPNVSPLKKSLIEKHWQRKHGKDAYYGQ